MGTTLLGAGIACMIAAIVGGGLKAFGIEIPVLASARRQLALGAFGALLLVAAFLSGSVGWRARQATAADASRTAASETGRSDCLAGGFSGVPSGRTRHAESGSSAFEVLPASESKDAPVAVVVEESRRPVGAVEFEYFAGTQIFKILQVVDADCQPVTAFVNSSRGGDKQVLENWDTVEMTFPAGRYALRLGYRDGAISGSLTHVR
jgi:hypothetical protein